MSCHLHTRGTIRRITFMGRDYIVDEVRRIREEQAARHNFDIKAILSSAKKRQRESGRKVVSFVPKKKSSSRIQPVLSPR